MNTAPRNGLIRFFSAPPMPCPYLSGRLERQVVTMLSAAENPDQLHTMLSQAGFRRSYNIAYKPACEQCNACVPVRVRVKDWQPTRSQKRILKSNSMVRVRHLPATAASDHYEIFKKYQQARHRQGSMADMSYDDYRDMIQETPVNSAIMEFRDYDGRLIGCSLTDILGDGLSMVYSFFDPVDDDRSPGVYFVLWHIMRARELGLPYVYLGYWIQDSRKMAYKVFYHPIEVLRPAGWQDLPRQKPFNLTSDLVSFDSELAAGRHDGVA